MKKKYTGNIPDTYSIKRYKYRVIRELNKFVSIPDSVFVMKGASKS